MKTHISRSIPDRYATALEAQWRRMGVYKASQTSSQPACSTGWSMLDSVLPGAGYPLGAVTELLIEQAGAGELSFLLAALAPRLADDADSRLVFVEPPHDISARAINDLGVEPHRVPVIRCATTAERVWSIEQLAAAGGFCGFVLWDSNITPAALRRLQLAGEKAGCPVFVYRNIRCARQRSPAALRLAVTCRSGRQRLEILKCRGPAGAHVHGLQIHRDLAWHWPSETLTPAKLSACPAGNDWHFYKPATEAHGAEPIARQDGPTAGYSIPSREHSPRHCPR